MCLPKSCASNLHGLSQLVISFQSKERANCHLDCAVIKFSSCLGFLSSTPGDEHISKTVSGASPAKSQESSRSGHGTKQRSPRVLLKRWQRWNLKLNLVMSRGSMHMIIVTTMLMIMMISFGYSTWQSDCSN